MDYLPHVCFSLVSADEFNLLLFRLDGGGGFLRGGLTLGPDGEQPMTGRGPGKCTCFKTKQWNNYETRCERSEALTCSFLGNSVFAMSSFWWNITNRRLLQVLVNRIRTHWTRKEEKFIPRTWTCQQVTSCLAAVCLSKCQRFSEGKLKLFVLKVAEWSHRKICIISICNWSHRDCSHLLNTTRSCDS